VHGAGREFFARARATVDEDRGLTRRDERYEMVHLAHRRTAADQFGQHTVFGIGCGGRAGFGARSQVRFANAFEEFLRGVRV